MKYTNYNQNFLKGYVTAEDLSKIKKYKSSKKSKVTKALSETTIIEIIESVKTKLNIADTALAISLVVGVLQSGGTNRGAGSSVSYVIDKYSLNAQELQKIVTSVQKNATNRQLARGMADTIFELSMEFEIEGDLASQLVLDYPEASFEEKVWCSNFQTTNMNCPDRIRDWLVHNYKDRFNR